MSAASPLRVLVVDDSDDAAVTMAFMLKRFGHEAVVAHGGQEALQQAPQFHPDAMLIDLTMPDIDGFTVARQLRQTAEFAETPMVAVSGHVDVEHRTQATAAGFTEFLPKPFPLTVLETVLERIAARKSASRTVGRRTAVSIKKSGLSSILTLQQRSSADELRSWLREQCCRVGPVFESERGQFSFFIYSKRHAIGELVDRHGGFRATAAD